MAPHQRMGTKTSAPYIAKRCRLLNQKGIADSPLYVRPASPTAQAGGDMNHDR